MNDNTRAVVVFAPAMSEDGQWHEVHNGDDPKIVETWL
jgi:hypothetical protein